MKEDLKENIIEIMSFLKKEGMDAKYVGQKVIDVHPFDESMHEIGETVLKPECPVVIDLSELTIKD